jgi:hypothetical protein
MKRGLKMPLTSALWLANALLWLLLVLFLAARIQQVFFAGETPLLRFDPVVATSLPPLALASASTRNPFDPTGSPWQAADAPAPTAAPGQVRGIVVLPGVGVALTDRGVIKTGESLDAGRLLSVKISGVMVDTPSGPQGLLLPGANRPALQDLNQEKPAAPPPAVSKQGKP